MTWLRLKLELRQGARISKAFGVQASMETLDDNTMEGQAPIPTLNGDSGGIKSPPSYLTLPQSANKTPLEDIVHWETLTIEGALQVLESSEKQHPLDKYIALCWKCRKERNLGFAKRLLMHVKDVGLEGHDVLGNHLVSMFVDCRSVWDANELFNTLVHQNERSWTSLIQGYVECGQPETALFIFQKLQQYPAHCSRFAITATLKACTRLKDTHQGREIHAKIVEERLEMDQTLNNTLVDMYCKCGLLSDAETVFNKIRSRDLVSWNALIGGSAEHGSGIHIERCLEQMKSDGISPDPVTYLCILKSCDKREASNKVLEVHAEIVKEGFERVLFIGNNLVHMYVNFGFLAEAGKVLSNLSGRNVVSWTSLIAGYADSGDAENASSCLECMKNDGVSPNEATYVCILKACGSIVRGQELHAEIAKGGLDKNLFVGNILVDMYSKCGSVIDAQRVFDQLPTPDVVSWTALLMGYADHGFFMEALNFLQRMQDEGVTPNATTFLCSLKACQSLGDLNKGQDIHAMVIKEEFEGELFVANTLVDLYGSCGLLVDAKEVFEELPARNIVSWNALISGFAEQGDTEATLNFLNQMELDGDTPNVTTFICSLKACGSLSASSLGQEIHMWVLKKGLECDLFFANSLVDMYTKCGLLMEAQKVFHGIEGRDAVSWNSLMAGYGDFGLGVEVLDCLETMVKECVAPNAPTFATILKACKESGFIDTGCEMHAKVIAGGFENDPFVSNSVVDMYATQGLLEEAQYVFDQHLFRSVITWTALIGGYIEHGFGEKAVECFEKMQQKRVALDATVYVCGLKACGNTGSIEKGRELFSEVIKLGILDKTGKSDSNVLMLPNVLIDMHCKCGSLADAQEVSKTVPTKDLVTWNALISGHALLGQPESSLLLFEEMKLQRILPDAATYASVLTACNHVGHVTKGLLYIEEMSKEYSVEQTRQHHNCIIDLLARAGQLNVAMAIVEKMPFHPDLVTWMSVLSSCRKWGNVELGRHVFECAISLVETHLSGFVLMSNIYMEAQMWEDAKEIEEMRAMVRTGIG